MTNAEHIFQWARNSQPHYLRMKELEPMKFRYNAVVDLARDTHKDMVRCGEIQPGDYTAKDALQAAILMLDWDGEE